MKLSHMQKNAWKPHALVRWQVGPPLGIELGVAVLAQDQSGHLKVRDRV